MAYWTPIQIGVAAAKACFYIDPKRGRLRMQFTDFKREKFMATDDGFDKDYWITFQEVADQDDPHFEEAVRIAI